MARKRMITREFKVTQGSAIQIIKETKETASFDFAVSGEYKDESKLLKKLKETYDDSESSVVYVADTQVVTVLRGMYEQDFLDNSIELDPETRKPIEGSQSE